MSAPAKAWMGLDVGATKLLGVVVSADGAVQARLTTATDRDDGPAAVIDRCTAVAEALRESAGPVAGIGVGFAGLVDHASGRVRSSIMLPSWSDVALADELAGRLDVPCRVENDATAAGYGELCALGKPAGLHLVVLTVGTGIGGAIVIDGELYRGASGTSAELGNMTIERDGPECWCGGRGCLNTLASGSAIAARAAELYGDGKARSVEELARLADAGDVPAREAIEGGARALGVGIANVINVFNPNRVALSGGVTALGAPWLDAVRAEARRRAFAESVAAATIDLCRDGADAGAVGAACLARDFGPSGGGGA